jgi:hypothetical protein
MIDGKVSPPFSGETSKSMAALRYASELTLSLGINKSIGYQGWILIFRLVPTNHLAVGSKVMVEPLNR